MERKKTPPEYGESVCGFSYDKVGGERAAYRAHDGRLPVEQVIADGAGGAG
jgi:hypothetical protein